MTETNEELAARIKELEAKLEAEKAKSESAKTRIQNALDSGVNNMEDLAEITGINNKSLSSNLTRLRKELQSEDKTIITQRHKGKTMIAIVSLEVLGW